MITEKLGFKGRLNIVLRDEHGNIKDEREVDNLVVTSGLTFIASRMAGNSKAVMGYMGLGSGTTAAAAGQTDLVTLVGTRVSLSSTTPGTSNVVYSATFGQNTSTGAITEAGIFNAVSGGDMLCRTVFAVVNKQAGDSMTITWTISLVAQAA